MLSSLLDLGGAELCERTVPPYFEPLVRHVVACVLRRCLSLRRTSPWRVGGTSKGALAGQSTGRLLSGPWRFAVVLSACCRGGQDPL